MYKKIILFLLVLNLFANSCVKCHKNYKIDEIHNFKCTKCHNGNDKTDYKNLAHKNLIVNPARLEHAKIFCTPCHSNIINRVSNSIMNTQSGIIDVLRFQFKENSKIIKTNGIKDLINKKNLSLAEDHFSKFCAACHINQKKELFKNGYVKRGGGCIDCHLKELRIENGELRCSEAELRNEVRTIENFHPKFTTKIPNETCLKCHNRSNRIGLSYVGKFESEGYWQTKKGKIINKLDRNRFFYHLPVDLHYKAGMSCIDCHTEVGVMGDSKAHTHMESAVDIGCNDCHNPKFVKEQNHPLAIKLALLNNNVPLKEYIAITQKKSTPLYNVVKEGKKTILYRKLDGKKLIIPKFSNNNYHKWDFHKRLDCSACHSSWIPSCYGCHEIYFKNSYQFDWIKHRKTLGKWLEKRSYLRYEDSTLAIGYNKKIMLSAPGCQVFMNIYDKKNYQKSFTSLAYATWNPHTTSKSKNCNECHFNPSSLGLGKGRLDLKNNKISFISYFEPKKGGFNLDFALDSLVDLNGTAKQSFSRDFARAFKKSEIKKIVEVYKCSICHDNWSDKIYKDFKKSKKLFYLKQTKCAKEILKIN